MSDLSDLDFSQAQGHTRGYPYFVRYGILLCGARDGGLQVGHLLVTAEGLQCEDCAGDKCA